MSSVRGVRVTQTMRVPCCRRLRHTKGHHSLQRGVSHSTVSPVLFVTPADGATNLQFSETDRQTHIAADE